MKDDVLTRIIHAGKTVFGRHGFRKAALADIAAEARMAKSSLYHYFPNKEELFRAVVNAEMEVLSTRVRDAVDREKLPEAKVKAFVLTRMRVVQELASAYATLHEDYLDQLGFVERLREETFQAEVDVLRGILEDGVRSEAFEIADLGLAAYAMALALKGLEYPWAVKSTQADLDRDLELLVGMLMRAIRK